MYLNRHKLHVLDTLRNALILPTMLSLTYSGGNLPIDTDACNAQIICVLLQKQPDKTTKIFGYSSPSLTNTEKLYYTMQLECLAIVWSVLLLRTYLEVQPFTIRTNNNGLKWILNLADVTERLAYWRFHLLLFHFDVIHRPRI